MIMFEEFARLLDPRADRSAFWNALFEDSDGPPGIPETWAASEVDDLRISADDAARARARRGAAAYRRLEPWLAAHRRRGSTAAEAWRRCPSPLALHRAARVAGLPARRLLAAAAEIARANAERQLRRGYAAFPADCRAVVDAAAAYAAGAVDAVTFRGVYDAAGLVDEDADGNFLYTDRHRAFGNALGALSALRDAVVGHDDLEYLDPVGESIYASTGMVTYGLRKNRRRARREAARIFRAHVAFDEVAAAARRRLDTMAVAGIGDAPEALAWSLGRN